MLRRQALTALGTTAVLSPLLQPALAQTTAASPAASSALMELRQRALAGNTFSTNSSKLALTKGSATAVTTFAKFEVAEQQSILRAMQLAGLPLPQSVVLDSEQMQMTQQLQAASGAEFDRLYIRGQLVGHRELLRLHQSLMTSGTPSEQVISTIAVPSIEQHIAMLQAL